MIEHTAPVIPEDTFCNQQFSNNEISIISWNILAPSLCDEYKFHKDQNRDHLQWKYRETLLLNTLSTYQHVDFLCLQEVEKEYFEQTLLPFMKQYNFNAVMQNKPIGNATFFNATKWKLKHSNPRSRTIITVFEKIENSMEVCVVNCHLEGHPEKSQERCNQIKSSIAELKKYCKTKQFHTQHILLCGDFNDDPQSGIYSLLREKGISKEVLDPYTEKPYTVEDFSHPYVMESVYKSSEWNREPDFTFYKLGMRPSTVDFIFYSCETMQLKQAKSVASQVEKVEIKRTGLPNATHCSDHLSIGAVLQLM